MIWLLNFNEKHFSKKEKREIFKEEHIFQNKFKLYLELWNSNHLLEFNTWSFYTIMITLLIIKITICIKSIKIIAFLLIKNSILNTWDFCKITLHTKFAALNFYIIYSDYV